MYYIYLHRAIYRVSIYLHTGSLIDPGSHQLIRLDCQQASRILLSLISPHVGIIGIYSTTEYLCACGESELRSYWVLMTAGEGESVLCEGRVPGRLSILPQMVLYPSAALIGLSKLWSGERQKYGVNMIQVHCI